MRNIFDNLYFVGTRIHSSWALTTTDGIILIDTLFDYAIEPEIVEGLTTLGLDPGRIKYVLIRRPCVRIVHTFVRSRTPRDYNTGV